MRPIVRVLLGLAAVVIVIIIGFNIHWLLGVGIIVAILGYSIFANRALIYATRANMAYAKGDQDQALELLEKAYRTKNASAQHMIGYGFLLTKTGSVERAEQLLKEVLSQPLSDQLKLQAKVNLATAYWLQGKQDEALDLLEKMAPDYQNTQLYGNLGYFKLLWGDDLEAALAFNKEAYEYNSDDVTIRDNLAQNYYLLGRMEEAREAYAHVMELSPKSADSYYYYALTLQAMGEIEEAREQIKLAKEKDLAVVTTLTREDIDRLAEQLG